MYLVSIFSCQLSVISEAWKSRAWMVFHLLTINDVGNDFIFKKALKYERKKRETPTKCEVKLRDKVKLPVGGPY